MGEYDGVDSAGAMPASRPYLGRVKDEVALPNGE